MRKSEGFTLVELLAVIAIIALLTAILLPTLQRVRNQAKAVVCQSNQKQWGTLWAMSVSENGGYFPGSGPDDRRLEGQRWGWGYGWGGLGGQDDRDRYRATKDIRLCPMATRPASLAGRGDWKGGTFLAWGRFITKDKWKSDIPGSWETSYSSYGVGYVSDYPPGRERDTDFWITPHVKGASNIPLHLDSSSPWGWGWSGGAQWPHGPEPPECDAIPTVYAQNQGGRNPYCINRHNGGINSLFMDWSVRKVGLKELWTLKWHKRYDTHNCWTKAGGAQPEDWPEWMRGFRDY